MSVSVSASSFVNAIATMFLTTVLPSGLLEVQDAAARAFAVLGFAPEHTADGRPRFARVADAHIFMRKTTARNKSITRDSFEEAGWDFDVCIPYLGKTDKRGYTNASVRRRIFSDAIGFQLTSKDDLDHVCHTDACDDTNGCSHRACINPYHMAIASRTENVKRSMGNRYHSGMSTHCRKGGHEFTLENTRLNKDGHRQCIACEDARRAAVKSGDYVPRKRSVTHCNHGHDRSVYTRTAKNGGKYCGKCKSETMLHGARGGGFTGHRSR